MRNKATNEVDALGWTNHYELDNTTGNLRRHHDDIGDLVRYTYTTNGLVSSSIDANGNTNRFTYDTNGFLIARVDAAGFTNSYTYNEVGWKFSETNPLGEVATYAYDLNGNIVLTHDPLGRDFIRRYDEVGNLLAASDGKSGADKRYTTNAFDAASQKISTTDRTGTNTARFAYTPRGEMLATTNALTNVTLYTYDNANRLIRVTDPEGNSITNVYDANGNKTNLIDQLGQRWVKTYDRLNRVIAETDPLGNTRQTSYDQVGRISQITTPKGFPSLHFYDGRGRLTNWVDAESFRWLYAYDGNGNITNITDALTNHYVMVYSNRNERILEQNQDSNRWEYAYDPLLRLKTQRDPNGTTRALDYDAGGRVLSVTFNTGRVNSFSYDRNNNPRVLSRSGSGPPTISLLSYDVMDRVTSYEDAFGQEIHYAYDALGRVSTLTYPDGKTLTYVYDALSRLTNQVFTGQRPMTYTYDKAGRLKTRTYPNGITQTNTFDDAGRITSLSYSNFSLQPSTLNIALTYAYDRNGNKTASTEQGTLNWPMPSLRDETSRFTASGRITNRVDALSPTNNFTYQYDASGNMTNATGGGQTWALTYDEDNRTTSILWDCVTTSKNITNRYDALGRRVARTVDNAETRFVLDLAGSMERILCDMNGAGAITAWYVHGPDLCYKVDATNGLTCYHADAQANIIALTDSNTNVVAQYAYTPYGRSLGSTNFQLSAFSFQPFTFVGSQGVMEELPGLYFMRARYYSADAAVFLSTDPVKHIGPRWKAEAYTYANENPLAYYDPKGEFVPLVGAAIGAVVGGAIDVGYQKLVEHKNWEDVNWVSVAGSAGKGALMGSGVGIVAAVVGSGAIGAITETGSEYIYGGEKVDDFHRTPGELNAGAIAVEGVWSASSAFMSQVNVGNQGQCIYLLRIYR